jgi:hypothetical protein
VSSLTASFFPSLLQRYEKAGGITSGKPPGKSNSHLSLPPSRRIKFSAASLSRAARRLRGRGIYPALDQREHRSLWNPISATPQQADGEFFSIKVFDLSNSADPAYAPKDSDDLEIAPVATALASLEGGGTEGLYDWGRVRGYFTGGVIFSKERQNFSQTDALLAFTLDKNYLKRAGFNINTFFDARLTSIPVPRTMMDGMNGEGGGGGAGGTGDNLDTFLTSEKAAMMQTGIYVPINVSAWKFRKNLNTLFIAPLAKIGVQSITSRDSATPVSAEAATFGSDDIFLFYSFGARIGHFRYPGRALDQNVAPELISWLDISRGKFENFELDIPTGQMDAMGNPITSRVQRYRWEAQGRLKIPETPFLIGFDGNFGDGPDDLRFIFGTRFDIGKLIGKLKGLDAQQQAAARTEGAAAATTPEP